MTQSSSNSPLYPMSDRERHNINQSTTYPQINSLPEIWPIAAQKFANITAVHAPHNKPVTKLSYQELWQQIQLFASG
ncbi:MAG: long-chain fatty acid--CoA ligase, partial [Microcoleaceae cyanobacterium]